MKLLVTGTRDWPEPERVQQTLWRRLRELHEARPDMTVLVGDARGVDAWTYAWCFANGVPVERYEAHWRAGGVYNPLAGHQRNQRMVDEKPDRCLVIWDGKSTGTKDCTDRAFCAGVAIEYVLEGLT